jgi:hypothetical protein
LFRLLRDIDAAQIEHAQIGLVAPLIRARKFRRSLIANCYPIAIAGSRKLARDSRWDENRLPRTRGTGEHCHIQYFARCACIIALIRQSCAGPWLNAERICPLLRQPCQLRLE